MLNPQWQLHGKKALITGGTKGIGLATAQEFLHLGAEVIIVARDKAALDSWVSQWQSAGFSASGIAADLAVHEERQKVARFVDNTWDGLDILVNNAGTNIRKQTTEYNEDDIVKLFNINLSSAYGLSRLCYPLLSSKPGASIVNVASIAGLIHLRSGSPYGMTKAAMIQMTRNLAVEWAPHGIRVNAVAPGLTKTPLTEYWFQPGNEAAGKDFISKTPLARAGEAKEIAAAITFLAMPASSFITGHCLVVDGGFTINAF